VSQASNGTCISAVALHTCNTFAIITIAQILNNPWDQVVGEPWAQDLTVNLSSRRWKGRDVRSCPRWGPTSHFKRGNWWGGVADHLADSPVCPFRRAPCCVRVAVPCWLSARCWPSSPSCCPADPARGESAPWLATCRQQQASDGDFALWGGKMGFPQGAAWPFTASWISVARAACKP